MELHSHPDNAVGVLDTEVKAFRQCGLGFTVFVDSAVSGSIIRAYGAIRFQTMDNMRPQQV